MQGHSAQCVQILAKEKRWSLRPCGEDQRMLKPMGWDADRVSALLRCLEPLHEKVVRLHYGLGCQRAHSEPETARALQVSPAVIVGILAKAEEQLSPLGLTPRRLRAAARVNQDSGADGNPGMPRKARSCRGRAR